MVRCFEKLSASSRYHRCFTPITELSSKQIADMTNNENDNHLALVALDVSQNPNVGIGVASYVKSKDKPHLAEFAITIIDAYQGKGLGRKFFELLIHYARENEISIFQGYILGGNVPIKSLLRPYNPQIYHEEGSIFRVEIPLNS